jgi:hypothetical protein
MLGCEVLFGKTQGAHVRAMVEDSIGTTCPCALDLPCPLIVPPPAPEIPLIAALIAEAVDKKRVSTGEGRLPSMGV